MGRIHEESRLASQADAQILRAADAATERALSTEHFSSVLSDEDVASVAQSADSG